MGGRVKAGKYTDDWYNDVYKKEFNHNEWIDKRGD